MAGWSGAPAPTRASAQVPSSSLPPSLPPRPSPPPPPRIRTPNSADRIGTTYSIRFVDCNLTRIRVLSFQLSFAFFCDFFFGVCGECLVLSGASWFSFLRLLMFLLMFAVKRGFGAKKLCTCTNGRLFPLPLPLDFGTQHEHQSRTQWWDVWSSFLLNVQDHTST